MPRIKVDTELLKQKAKRLTEIGRLFDQMGSELVYQSNRVPSYNGQLSGPAHKAGVVAQYDANVLRDQINDHSETLYKLAEQFEKVDQSLIDQLNGFIDWLHSMIDLADAMKDLFVTLFLAPPAPILNMEEYYGKYLQNQGQSDRCADFSLSMICNIYFEAKGESTARCNVDLITMFIQSIVHGKFPWKNGGTTPWGIEAALIMLGIPFTFHPFGSLTDLENALQDGKIIIISEGKIMDPNNNDQTWGHVMVIVGEDEDDLLMLDPSQPEGSGVTRMKKSELMNKWWYPPFHPCWIIG